MQEQTELWKGIWKPTQEATQYPDPFGQLLERHIHKQILDVREVFPAVRTAEEIRKASQKFKRRTGLSADMVHPRDVGQACDEALTTLGYLFSRAEMIGHMPS
eukprot:8230097-Pyramimonas_sp.AAC.1